MKKFKLAVFVPLSHLEKISQAIFSAGGGRIGRYDQCSFYSLGTGTFRPLAKAKPYKGRSRKLSRAAEARLEVVVPAGRIKLVIKALKKAHPYEEPAFDLYPLAKL